MNNLLTLFICIFFTASSWSQDGDVIEKILGEEVFNHASVGLVIKDLDTKAIVFSHNPNLALIPASTLKLITTFSILEILGEDHRFITDILYDGEILSDGTLYGNIIVRGGGDPSLGSPNFEMVKDAKEINHSILKAIRKAGIKCIEGEVVIDNSLFEGDAINNTWQWNDIGNYYAAGTWPLNFHENLFYIHFSRDHNPNSWTSVKRIEPAIPNLKVTSNVTIGEKGSGDNAYVYAHPYSNELTVKGTIPPGKGLFKIKAAIPNPGIYFKSQLENFFSNNGISIGHQEVKTLEANKLLYRIKSPSLSDIVHEANLESNNLYCETFLRQIGLAVSKKGSTEAGIKGIESLFEKLDLNTSSLTMADGSGLSTRNRISANLMVQYISKIYDLHGSKYFKKHLSSHTEGSYKNVFNRINENHFVYLKSGSMSEVQGYTGILRVNKRYLGISFMSNGHKFSNRRIRNTFQEIVKSIIESD